MEKQKTSGKKIALWIGGILTGLLVVLAVAAGLMLRLPEQLEADDLWRLRQALESDKNIAITLTADMTVDESLKVNGKKSITGGSLIYADGIDTQNPLLQLQEGAELTLQDTVVNANFRGDGIYVPAKASLTLENSTVCSGSSYNVYNDGTFTLASGALTGSAGENLITANTAQILSGEVSDAAKTNITVKAGNLKIQDGNIIRAGVNGIDVAKDAELIMDGELIRVRENANYGILVDGIFTLNYGNIVKNGTDNIYINDTGTMTMNDGYISAAVTCGIRNRGQLEVHGGIVEYNGTDGISTSGICRVDGGAISSNTRRGFTNETGGDLKVTGEKVKINGNKFGLYNEIGSKAELRKVTITGAGTNSIRNFGEVYLYDYTSKDSTSVHLSTLTGSYAYLENVTLDTNNRSHGIYNYRGTVEFKNLDIVNPTARGIRNLGGTVTGEKLQVRGVFTTGLTNENIEDATGNMVISDITLSGDFDYGVYQFGGNTTLTDLSVGVTQKNSLRTETGNLKITNANVDGCKQIPGSPDVAVYDGYFTGGTVELTNVTLKDSYSSLIRNKGAQVTLTGCELYNSGASAISNSHNGTIICNDVTVKNSKSTNVKQDGGGTIICNDCYLGVTPSTNVAAVDGKVVLDGTTVAGTNGPKEKVGFVIYEKGVGVMQGNSVVEKTYGKGVSNLGTFYMYGGTIRNCVSKNGAALNNEGTCYVYGGKLVNNTANKGNGGAVRAIGPIYFDGAIIEGNTASSAGGALSIGADAVLKDTVIRNNYTEGDVNGGAIYVASKTLTIDSGTKIYDNEAGRHGGALAVKAGAKVVINEGTEITNNTAGGNGGAVISYGDIVMDGGKLDKNEAAGLGGNIAVADGGKLILSGGTVSNGKAVNGQEIYAARNSVFELGSKAAVEGIIHMAAEPILLQDAHTKPLQIHCDSYYAGLQILTAAEGAPADTITGTIPQAVLGDPIWEIDDNGALKGDGYAAQIGETKYASLQAAMVAAQDGDTIALLSDSTVSGTITVDKAVTIAGNGFTLTHGSFAGNLFTVKGGSLTLGDGATELTIDGDKDNNSAIAARLIGVAANSQLIIQDKVTLQNATTTAGAAAILVDKGAVIMNGGAITGCTAATTGGAAHIKGGTFTMNGGAITGNTSVGHGGAICLEVGSFTMNGGEVSGNQTTAGNSGGIHVSKGTTCTIAGGQVTGNTTKKLGGNIAVASTGKLILSGGKISGGTAATGRNVYMASSAGTLEMSGGAVVADGDVYLAGGAKVSLKGDVAAATVTLSACTAGQQVLTGTEALLLDNYQKFILTNPDWAIQADGTLVSTATVYAAYIGEVGYDSLEAAVAVANAASENVTITLGRPLTIGGTITVTGKATILGDGHTLTHGTFGGNLFTVKDGGVLTLGDGTTELIVDGDKEGNTGANGRLFGVAANSQLIINSKVTLQNATTNAGAGAILVDGGTVTMNGGKIIDSVAATTGAAAYIKGGGTFNLTDGVISGNVSGGHGGAVYIEKGTFNMTGGEVSGNQTTGGNSGGIHVAKDTSCTISGGQVKNNTTAKVGGNIAVASTGKLILSGGTVSGGTAATGKNIYMASSAGTLAMSGGAVVADGDVYLAGGATVSVTGALSADTAAKLTLPAYAEGTQVLTGTEVKDNYQKFTLSSPDWGILEDGKLISTATAYAAFIGQTGYDTLEEAVTAANAMADGAVVTLGRNYTVSGTINITGKVTVAGKGYTLTHGATAGNMFTVKGGGILTLGDGATELTIDGDKTNNAGINGRLIGVAANSQLIINSKVTLQNATTTGGAAAILLDGGTATMNGGTISGCEAKTGTAVHIKNSGIFTLEDGTVSGNTTTSHGGAVYIEKGSFVMTGGEVSGNQTTGGNSGGIHVAKDTSCTVSGGAVKNNTTPNVGGNIAVAGNGKLYLSGGTVSGGTAATGKNIYMAGAAGTLELSGGTAVTEGDIYLNGGAVATVTGSVTEATLSLPAYAEGTQVLGGSAMAAGSQQIQMADSSWVIREDGTIFSIGEKKFFAGTTGYASFTEAVAAANTAGAPVTITLYDSVTLGEPVAVSGSVKLTNGQNDKAVTISRGSCAGAMFEVTGTLTLSGTSNGMLTVDGESVGGTAYRLVNVTAGGKLAVNSGAVLCNANSTGNGGAIYLNASTFKMTGGEVKNNVSTKVGAVLFAEASSAVSISGGTISGNTAATNGPIYVKKSTLTVSGGTISGNAGAVGGAIFCEGSAFKLTGGTITENTASSNGTVYLKKGSLTMTGGTITGNTVTGNGGGVYCESAPFTFGAGTISGNTAGGYGGGVVLTSSAMEMTGGEISGNTATKVGGGVVIRGADASMTMSAGTITGNTGTNGGGVYSEIAFTMTGGAITGNTGNGDLYVAKGAHSVTGEAQVGTVEPA